MPSMYATTAAKPNGCARQQRPLRISRLCCDWAAHHHGDQETILYVVEGIARYRWGERLEHVVEAGPGDFVFIPAHTVHQEINASTDSPTVWAVTRSGTDPIVVNLPELDKFAEPAAREYRHA